MQKMIAILPILPILKIENYVWEVCPERRVKFFELILTDEIFLLF